MSDALTQMIAYHERTARTLSGHGEDQDTIRQIETHRAWAEKLTTICLELLSALGEAGANLDRAVKAEAETEKVRRFLAIARKEAFDAIVERDTALANLDWARRVLVQVKEDCISRKPMSRDGQTVPISHGVWCALYDVVDALTPEETTP